jgi:hypothetical protein
VLEQAAEVGLAADLGWVGGMLERERDNLGIERLVVRALMGADGVVKFDVLADEMAQVALSEGGEMIEALALDFSSASSGRQWNRMEVAGRRRTTHFHYVPFCSTAPADSTNVTARNGKS